RPPRLRRTGHTPSGRGRRAIQRADGTAPRPTRRCAMDPTTARPDAPILNLVGDKVALGPLRHDLMPLYDRWFNDFEAGMPYFLQLRPRTREAREEWYERLAKDDPTT